MSFDVFGELEFEKDLLQCETLPNLIKNDLFAIKLYSALCNNTFYRGNIEFSPSWRYAGGLVTYMREILLDSNATYLDFYMSGNEGVVFSEIEAFLAKIGWRIKT